MTLYRHNGKLVRINGKLGGRIPQWVYIGDIVFQQAFQHAPASDGYADWESARDSAVLGEWGDWFNWSTPTVGFDGWMQVTRVGAGDFDMAVINSYKARIKWSEELDEDQQALLAASSKLKLIDVHFRGFNFSGEAPDDTPTEVYNFPEAAILFGDSVEKGLFLPFTETIEDVILPIDFIEEEKEITIKENYNYQWSKAPPGGDGTYSRSVLSVSLAMADYEIYGYVR